MSDKNTDARSLAHTKWNCKYHVVFAPKYRRKVLFQLEHEFDSTVFTVGNIPNEPSPVT